MRAAGLVGLALLVASGSGCRTVLDTVAGVFGPGQVGTDVDAHVVYRLRPDCPALLARTLSHGYTVLSPRETLDGAPLAFEVEPTGVFEGPVRTGEIVFRYMQPATAEGTGDLVDVIADVDGIRLDLETGLERLDVLCGPLPVQEPSDPAVPRLPGSE